VISFAGTLYLFSGGLDGGGGNPVLGGLMMLAGCFGWAMYAVLIKPLVRKYGGVKITLISTILPALPAMLFYNSHTFGTFSHLSQAAIYALLIMSLVGTIFSVNLWNYASAYLSASSTGASLYLIPPTVALFGWLFLHESTGPQTLTGGFIIMLGVAVAEFGKSFVTARAT
jgi:drug/metabolite transporter (DMT)-like permease